MFSWLRKKVSPALPAGPPYTPDLACIWRQDSYPLTIDLERGEFRLSMEYEIFPGLSIEHHRDCPRLVLNHAERCFDLEFGPRSTIRRVQLLGLSELTRIHYQRNCYIHERDWPAEDERAVQVLLLLKAGNRSLRFGMSDYAKFECDYAGPKMVDFLQDLARLAGCELVQTSGSERVPYEAIKDWPGSGDIEIP